MRLAAINGIRRWSRPIILYFSDNTGHLTDPAGAFITVRSALPPEQIVHTLRSTVAGIDPFLALDQVQPMTEAIANVEAPRRFNTGLVSAFALGALLLALTGIYALVAFSASLRTHEIAIRMSLGAQRTRIAKLILLSCREACTARMCTRCARLIGGGAYHGLSTFRSQCDGPIRLFGSCCDHGDYSNHGSGTSCEACCFFGSS